MIPSKENKEMLYEMIRQNFLTWTVRFFSVMMVDVVSVSHDSNKERRISGLTSSDKALIRALA